MTAPLRHDTTAPLRHDTVKIPVFEAGRLRYRAPEMRDFEAYAEFRGSDRAWGIGGPFPRSSAFGSFCAIAGHWHLRGYGRWMIADRETDTALGVVGLLYPDDWPEPEVAWSLFASAEGRGIAFEAALFSRNYAYDVLGWTTAISCVLPGNDRSAALARRMGAVREDDFDHPEHGVLQVWRHPGPEAVA